MQIKAKVGGNTTSGEFKALAIFFNALAANKESELIPAAEQPKQFIGEAGPKVVISDEPVQGQAQTAGQPQAQTQPTTRRRRTKAEIEAAEAAEKAKKEAAEAAAAPADDDGFVMDDDAGADGGDMILDDDDFVGGEVEPDIDYKAEVIKMAQAIQASKDTAKLSKVRAILTARKVQKITDLPETEMKGLYTEMKAI